MEAKEEKGFSKELEDILKEEYGAKDALDQPQFNVYDFLNKKFPNLASLENLNGYIAEVDQELAQTEAEIAKEIRHQGQIEEEMRKAVREQNALVEELVGRISKIKSKAEISENQVKTICSDIKNLDNAKKNLTWTISALKKQMMLITAIEQLRESCITP